MLLSFTVKKTFIQSCNFVITINIKEFVWLEFGAVDARFDGSFKTAFSRARLLRDF